MRIKIKTNDGREFEVRGDGYVNINDYTHYASHLVKSNLATYVEEPRITLLKKINAWMDQEYKGSGALLEIIEDHYKDHVKHSEVMRVYDEWDNQYHKLLSELRPKLDQLRGGGLR